MLDMMWILVCATLVFIMQPGLMCLEAGLTRSKNSINVAIKNLADFGFSSLIYWAAGFALMFGATRHGLWGSTGFLFSVESTDGRTVSIFIYETMFCVAAATIVSGAVAERMLTEAFHVSP